MRGYLLKVIQTDKKVTGKLHHAIMSDTFSTRFTLALLNLTAVVMFLHEYDT